MKPREALWHIEKLVPGGAGMARLDDGVVGFAEGALPGEKVAVEVGPTRKGATHARRVRVLEPSPQRVTPPCSIAERCGGCDWQHMSYAAQREAKAALIGEALRRTGGFKDLPTIEVMASPNELGYRLRVRLHIDERGSIGFYEKRSHRVISVSSCPVASPELERALADFQRLAAGQPELARYFEQAELRVSPLPPERVVVLTARGEPEPARRRAQALLDRLGQEFSVALSGLATNVAQEFPLSERLRLEVSPHAFVQVNWEVNLALVEAVVNGARERDVQRFLDAYAGAGNFTLPLAAAGLSGVSIEAQPDAARAARGAIARYGFASVEAVADDAVQALARLAQRREHFDLVVLDPPRAGAAGLLDSLALLAPAHIAYCACDPVTLARDLRVLSQRGFRLESVRGFDMFPGTHHVETLVWLARND
ncbi:MAG: class I SAM-dependent RNA methyltransferase [Myxococcota bacterium]